jgi:hypothetical protein
MTSNSRFGFNTDYSEGGADFTPIVKYDARAGRVFRVDRVQGANGFENNPIDITAIFKAVVDFEHVESGWIDFAAGSAPSFVLSPLGTQLPPRPSAKHKNGIRFLLKLNKACGGDKPVREIAGTSKAFLNGIEEVFLQYEAEKPKYPGKLPVLVLTSTTPIKSGSGTTTSTNYKPTFKIDGWAPRPEDLVHLPVSHDAPATAATAPATGSQTVAPPPGAAAAAMKTAAAAADDDFG